MTFIDRVHAGEREAVLTAIGDQEAELYDRKSASVTCPCGVEIEAKEAFRCFYCEVRFCRACAHDHFDGDPPKAVNALETAKDQHDRLRPQAFYEWWEGYFTEEA